MKCLTYDESAEWLAQTQVRVGGDRHLLFPGEHAKIMTNMPKTASALMRFSELATCWLPPGGTRLLWLSHWTTECPVHPLIIFERMRAGLGESRHIIEAPGHLFEKQTGVDQDILTGMVLLVMVFNWEAYLVFQNHEGFIYFGDEHIVYSSPDAEKMKEVSNFIKIFELKVINDIREAWN